MYRPVHFREGSPDVLHQWMREISLGTLVISHGDEFLADPLPWLLDAEPSPYGILKGHVARSNPIWRSAEGGAHALVIFQGESAYISPSWYESKREHGRVVPTWNYRTVHARGRLTTFHDQDGLLALVSALTNMHEKERTPSWQVADAPSDFIEGQLKAIVGVELRIEALEGKCKASQNRPEADRVATAHALEQEGQIGMADLVKKRS